MRLGKIINSDQDFIVFPRELLQAHTFLNGVTGSGKTNAILKFVEELRTPEFNAKYHDVQIILISVKDDYVLVPSFYNDFLLFSKNHYPQLYDVETAYQIGQRIRELGLSFVIKTSDFKTHHEKQEFIGRFIEGFRSIKLERARPVFLVIDEADFFVPNTKEKNHPSRDIIIDACSRARSEGISILLATQYATLVNPYARLECTNRVVGLTVELSYRKLVAEMLGDKSLTDKLWDLKKGQFYFRGQAFPSGVNLVQIEKSKITMPEMGVKISEPSGKKEYHDLLQISLTHEGTEPLLLQMQRELNESRILIRTLKARELTVEKTSEIFLRGYNQGYDDAENGKPHMRPVMER